ncbi:MAG: Arginine N-methyltransferase 2 [Piccolia ochrophora]|nr:MAG: Arginine N-methyltransferase 2 [Piccolia ochrophora]
MAEEEDADMRVQVTLLAAARHDLTELKGLLRSGSANVQDQETGYTPLHAAIAACSVDSDSPESVVDAQHADERTAQSKATQLEEAAKAKETVTLLLQNGAIWNDLDRNNETPGCLAHRRGLKDLYDIMVAAGVRAEMLLNRLDEYQELDDDEAASGEDDQQSLDSFDGPKNRQREGGEDHDNTNGTRSDQKLAAGLDVNTEDYMASTLRFHGDRILDENENGVMMSWEKDIMQRTADLLVPQQGLRILNIGFGMGIIDSMFQAHKPTSHHIVEAHPAVLANMREQGWYDKHDVVIHGEHWQQALPHLVEQNEVFDVIFFDTFAEDYKALREFFSEYAIALLDPQGGADGKGGSWSFFNGLGADRQICYDVYLKVVEMDLFEAGFDTEWERMPVPDLDARGEWSGVRRKYWALDDYQLPVCRFVG